ncbi:hypothetical protein PA598K_04898 [Paenibacillus sp. 598K]|nr:hypothetical protein PA598K_04898 [Paenibacillus sp. 598K]
MNSSLLYGDWAQTADRQPVPEWVSVAGKDCPAAAERLTETVLPAIVYSLIYEQQ